MHSIRRVAKEVLPTHNIREVSKIFLKNISLRTISEISSAAGTSLMHVFHAGNKNVPNASSNAEFVIIYHCAVNTNRKSLLCEEIATISLIGMKVL